VHFGGECKGPLDKIFNGGIGLGLERLHHNARATMRTIVDKNSIKKPAEEKISLVKRTDEFIASKEFEKNVGELAKKIAAKDADHYQIRLPPGLRDRVAQRAADNGRSMNTEIIEAIEQHLTGADRVSQLSEIFTKHRENIEAIPFLLYAMDYLSRTLNYSFGFNLQLINSFREWKELREPEYVATLPLVTPDQVRTLRALLKEIRMDEQMLLVLLRVNRIEDIRGFERAKESIEGLKGRTIMRWPGVKRTAADDIRQLLKETNTDEKNFLGLLGVSRIEDIPSLEEAKDIIERIRQSRAT
jgi:predicted DNA-binding protein